MILDKKKEIKKVVNKEYVKSDSVFNKMIITTMTMIVITTLIITTIFCAIFQVEMQKKIQMNSRKNIQKYANITYFRSEYAGMMLQQLQQSDDVNKLFRSENFNVNQRAQIIESLRQKQMTVPNLHSIYVYDSDEDVLYITGGDIPSNMVKLEISDDNSFRQIISNLASYDKFVPILRQVPVYASGSVVRYVNVYTYLIYDKFTSGKIKNIVALNFNIEWMKSALGYLQSDEDAQDEIRIIDNTGQIVFSNNNNEIGTICQRQDIIQELSKGSEEGSYLANNDKEQVVYAKASGYQNSKWTFVCIEDIQEPLRSLHKTQGIVYMVCFLFLLIGGTVIFIRLLRYYKPIQIKLSDLEEQKRKNIDAERTGFIKSMLYGNVEENHEYLQNKFQELQIPFELDGKVRLFLITIDYYKSVKQQYGNKIIEIEKALKEQIEKVFQKEYSRYICTELGEGELVLILHVDESMEEKVKSLFEELKVKIQKDITFSVSCSNYGDISTDAAFLLYDAQWIHSYTYKYGFGRVLTNEDVDTKEYVYPKEQESMIIKSLMKGEAQEAKSEFKEFIDAIYSCSINEIKIAYLQLAYAIKQHSMNTVAEISEFFLDFNDFCINIQTLDTMEAINQLFMHMLEDVSEKIGTHTREKYNKLIEKMKKIVEEKYVDSAFSINDIADEIDMTAIYLGRIFKQYSGGTFTEYLTNYRLSAARKLLEENELTVNEISENTGFSSSSYFYTVFKKYCGNTPNQYRQNYKNENK